MKIATAAAILAAALTFTSAVLHADEAIPPGAVTATIWVDGKGQSSMAKKLNEAHARMNAEGWRFVDLDIYSENGDMQGIFVTYVRTAEAAG